MVHLLINTTYVFWTMVCDAIIVACHICVGWNILKRRLRP